MCIFTQTLSSGGDSPRSILILILKAGYPPYVPNTSLYRSSYILPIQILCIDPGCSIIKMVSTVEK